MFPVISVTLKSVDGLRFQEARAALRSVIGMEAMRFQFIENSSKLNEKEDVSGIDRSRGWCVCNTGFVVADKFRGLITTERSNETAIDALLVQLAYI